LASVANDSIAVSALDLIRMVPNPYYAFSTYETTQLDNEVRITNLPDRCDISIFSLNGQLIQTIQVDNNTINTTKGAEAGQEQINTVKWDITNQKGVPIASGVYLVHISAPDLGEERVLKWFCVRRPVDLDIF